MKAIQFTAGIVLLVAAEILRIYFIMPLPGSQSENAVDVAYFIHTNIFYIRTVGWLITLFPLVHFYWVGRTPAKMIVTACLLGYILVFYLFNYKFQADKMFYQPDKVVFTSSADTVKNQQQLVLGVTSKGESRAYPIEIIGYHHQVRDTLAGELVMITYCTVCRTGRAYSPIVDGQPQTFRLVGMDQFNAMFEDETTGSWWRQVSGEAVSGPHKGKRLREIPSQQMTLSAWLSLYPESKILLPDSGFADNYSKMAKYDEGLSESALVGRDTSSWNEKSWIIGVQLGESSRAYDWNEVLSQRIIHDDIDGVKLLVTIASDSATFHVFERDSLSFETAVSGMTDIQTKSTWDDHGRAISGPLSGKRLKEVQAYQEFWHSWRTFHPRSTRFSAPATDL